jgi:hypothetical protein
MPQSQPLHYSESVLFVNNRHAEPWEGDPLFEQSVRTDHEIGTPVGYIAAYLLALAGGQGTRQENHSNRPGKPIRSENALEGRVAIAAEKLGK